MAQASVAEAVFGAELAAKEAMNEQTITVRKRITKAKSDLEEAKSMVESATLQDDVVIREVLASASLLITKCEEVFACYSTCLPYLRMTSSQPWIH